MTTHLRVLCSLCHNVNEVKPTLFVLQSKLVSALSDFKMCSGEDQTCVLKNRHKPD